MFQRRLRILVLILAMVSLAVVVRASRLQLSQGQEWKDKAQANITEVTPLPASRGRILDIKNNVLAVDEPCIDVAVAFRAIQDPVDTKWLDDRASRLARASPEWRQLDRRGRVELIGEMRMKTLGDLEAMWDLLAVLSGQTRQQINDKRAEIAAKVNRRREVVWRNQFEKKYDQWQNRTPDPWLVRLLVGEPPEPKFEEANVEIEEELQAHVILANVDTDVVNNLKLASDRLPGLTLIPGVRRSYPYGDIGAHVIGHLARVTREDIDEDPLRQTPNRRLLVSDRVGRAGIEQLAETQLRGTRGQVVEDDNSGQVQSSQASLPGTDVRTTIDIGLQARVHSAFERVEYQDASLETPNPNPVEKIRMPGAAVVIHVPTGEVRALVSYPSYDLNRFEELYSKLLGDELEQPMMNRATSFMQEPGSTVKPLVALAAITQGLIPADGTIECDGYLRIDGKRVGFGRCWTMSVFNIGHHKVPYDAAHPTGKLNAQDAIERSCNVYFESLGDQLKLEGLSYWYEQFGLGQPTGIGLSERAGVLPKSFRGEAGERRPAAAMAAIGQGSILVTPLQLANACATIARRGVWMRPKLMSGGNVAVPVPPNDTRGDKVTLHLNPQAVDAVQRGMKAVVNGPAGTGKRMAREEVLVSGKTGTATAAKLSVFQRDENGVIRRDASGDPIVEQIEYGRAGRLNRDIPWYRLSNIERGTANHAWVMGYLPSDRPEYAIAVFVQYGNKGGLSAGSVAVEIIQALEELGYVKPSPATRPTELLSD
jgi:penicillin-binding protein 2